MVRKYKRKRPAVDESKIKAAVIAVRRENMSVRSAAKLHGVGRTTLSNYLRDTSEEKAIAIANIDKPYNGFD